MNNLKAYFQFPDACLLEKRVHKKVMLGNAVLTSSERKAVQEEIESIHWVAALKPANCNIPATLTTATAYDEIHWMILKLRRQEAAGRLASIMQKAIPYPLVLILFSDGQIALQVAEKRINQSDVSRRTLMHQQLTPWFHPESDLAQTFLHSLRFSQLSTENLQKHYTDIGARITQYLSAGHTGSFKEDFGDRAKVTAAQLDQISEIDGEIAKTISAIKKESQFNLKVELNIRLKKLEMQKHSLIEGLKS